MADRLGRNPQNLQTHIDHVRDSGAIDALKLKKLWRVRNSLRVRNFVLELIVIDLLATKKKASLEEQLEHVFRELVAKAETICVKDPANPEGNDLSVLLGSDVRSELKSIANVAVGLIEAKNWEAIFGPVPQEVTKEAKREQIRQAVAAVAAPSKPWAK